MKKIIIGVLTSATLLFGAFDDAGTDFSERNQYEFIEGGETLKDIKRVNFFIDIASKLDINNLNKGTIKNEIISIIDNSSGTQSLFSMNATYELTRADNSSPMIAKLWGNDVDGSQSVIAKVSVTQDSSESAPFGAFEFGYMLFPTADTSLSVGAGFIKASVVDGKNILSMQFEYYNSGSMVNEKIYVERDANRTIGWIDVDGNQSKILVESGVFTTKNNGVYNAYDMNSTTLNSEFFGLFDKVSGAELDTSDGDVTSCYGMASTTFIAGYASIDQENSPISFTVPSDNIIECSQGGTTKEFAIKRLVATSSLVVDNNATNTVLENFAIHSSAVTPLVKADVKSIGARPQ